MPAQNGKGRQEADHGGQWEGYSDYRSVSQRLGRSIDEAIDAYAVVKRLHVEGARVRGQAADASSRILAAAMRLVPELKEHREQKEIYDEILSRWLDGEETEGVGEVPDEGYLTALENTQLHRECPDWLSQFVLDIRTAGWHLGYLQAGRQTEEEPEDPVEADVESMFE